MSKKTYLWIFSFGLLVSLSVGLMADAVISKIAGAVAVKQKDIWKDAAVGMILGTADRIRTGPGARAELLVGGLSRVYLKESSEIEVGSLGQESYFNLLLGKLRAKVKLVGASSKFTVKTPVCVASVRGTDFVVDSGGQLVVLSGEVEFSGVDAPQSVLVGAGYLAQIPVGGGEIKPQELSETDRSSIQQEWEAFEKEEPAAPVPSKSEGKKLEEKVENKIAEEIKELRREMNRIAVDIKTDIATVRDLTNEVREGDFAAGRSLRDIHGNLVRVEQMLVRPDNKTFQLLNIVKRNSYVYRGYFAREYPEYKDYTTGPRIDTAELRIKFNKGLPDQITEWPKFIAAEGDNLKIDTIDAKLTNQVDSLSWHGQRDLITDEMKMDADINGWKVDTEYQSVKDGTSGGGEESGDLWNWAKSPDIQIIGLHNEKKIVYLLTESYAINNDGKVLNINDIASNSSLDPFTFLKSVAGENITFCRDSLGRDGQDFFARKNIDLIITPDLAITIGTKMMSQVSNLNFESSTK